MQEKLGYVLPNCNERNIYFEIGFDVYVFFLYVCLKPGKW